MSVRDLKCAEGVGEVSRLGGFDTEFIMYGCGYVEEGKIKYRVSSRAMEIYKFIGKSMVKGIYPTPVMSRSERGAVPPDQREEISQQIKINLAKEIKERYSKLYFRSLNQFSQQAPNNSAYELLMEQQEQLEGLFDEEELIKFEGLAQRAYEAKVLTDESFGQIQMWLGKNRAQMEGRGVVKEAFEKSFFGFAYEDEDGRLKYVVNALEEVVWEKKILFDQQGIITTSIISKKYWSNQAMDVAKIRKNFSARLQAMMNQEYMYLLKQLKSLPSAINKEVFLQQLESIREDCSTEATESFERYGYLWNVL